MIGVESAGLVLAEGLSMRITKHSDSGADGPDWIIFKRDDGLFTSLIEDEEGQYFYLQPDGKGANMMHAFESLEDVQETLALRNLIRAK